MTLSPNINNLEKDKFVDANGVTAVNVVDASVFTPPPGTDAGTIDYPNSTTEVIKFRSGGVSGTILKTLTVVYTDSTKSNLASWAFS